ncbi:MAG: tRNA threonylcarbamoyladenosine dehydratase [Clostridia bacterium]|nr:tRNA threonylcarbamoyladenosine dehydratase [Clostridia bacterium]
MDWTQRTEMILGAQSRAALKSARVAVFGLGGVGSYTAEALVRAGVGHISLLDGDVYEQSNLNRQLYATTDTLGRPKAEAARERALSINPECDVKALSLFYSQENADSVDLSAFDYVADCIDTVKSKLLIIERSVQAGVPVISCMGTGNKLHPEMLKIGDISETSVCPLARVMRRETRRMGIEHLKVLYSTETPLTPAGGGRTPGSVSFVPSCAGLMIAGQIVRDIIGR